MSEANEGGKRNIIPYVVLGIVGLYNSTVWTQFRCLVSASVLVCVCSYCSLRIGVGYRAREHWTGFIYVRNVILWGWMGKYEVFGIVQLWLNDKQDVTSVYVCVCVFFCSHHPFGQLYVQLECTCTSKMYTGNCVTCFPFPVSFVIFICQYNTSRHCSLGHFSQSPSESCSLSWNVHQTPFITLIKHFNRSLVERGLSFAPTIKLVLTHFSNT